MCRLNNSIGRQLPFLGILFSLSTMGHIAGLLFVNFVLCLICFIAYSSQIFIIWPWYGREVSIELLTLLVPFK